MRRIYFNRELSWLDFNERVLEEALRPELPPLERYKFLTIVSSNFDEFFMVRMSAIKRAIQDNNVIVFSNGQTVKELYNDIQKKSRGIIEKQYDCLLNDVFPGLAATGLRFTSMNELNKPQKQFIKQYIFDKIFPLLNPLNSENNIRIAGETLYTAFLLWKKGTKGTDGNIFKIVTIRIPHYRIIILPSSNDKSVRFVLLEEAVQHFAPYLFPDYFIKESMLFKIDRDADFFVDEACDKDIVKAMEDVVTKREYSRAIRMTYSAGSDLLRDELACRLELETSDIYFIPGPLHLANLASLYNIEDFGISGVKKLKPSFRAKQFIFFKNNIENDNKSLWTRIKENDILLHFPYESFNPVLNFFYEAARDPYVREIKTTLYRTSGNSPVVHALKEAALNGKQVTAIVELKARFDEERNINWAKDLEKSGATVIYGLAQLKIHAKAALVTRKEGTNFCSYLNLSTGNYNEKTAKMYADLCLFTADKHFTDEAASFFDMIVHYSKTANHVSTKNTGCLIIAPLSLKEHLIKLIKRETEQALKGASALIKAKMNAIADTDVIDALYTASCAGVKIFLNIRGICMLVPGIPGLSENITVVSVIDHFLEHSRIIFFENGGNTELYLSSADWMTRNLERRIELMFPIIDKDIKNRLRAVLDSFFKDNCQAHTLGADGVWKRLHPAAGEKPFQVQRYLKEYTDNLVS
ncbi:MAG: polyphosphate kinase 1 [Spirochaetaceae bacterium]|jgi:polyphosphate kinase|nr:polyphosphate kinase 1 [Spirochaetaceae bacterium]